MPAVKYLHLFIYLPTIKYLREHVSSKSDTSYTIKRTGLYMYHNDAALSSACCPEIDIHADYMGDYVELMCPTLTCELVRAKHP